jgi:hypothetical protein
MQGLSAFLEANYESCKSSLAYRSLLAFHNLGNQHHGYFAQGTRRIQILICRHRHVYQVDGSYASSKHHTRSNSQVPIEYYIQVRHNQLGPHI